MTTDRLLTMSNEVAFLLWVMKEGYKINTSNGLIYPDDKIWTKTPTVYKGLLISSNELYELFEQAYIKQK